MEFVATLDSCNHLFHVTILLKIKNTNIEPIVTEAVATTDLDSMK